MVSEKTSAMITNILIAMICRTNNNNNNKIHRKIDIVQLIRRMFVYLFFYSFKLVDFTSQQFSFHITLFPLKKIVSYIISFIVDTIKKKLLFLIGVLYFIIIIGGIKRTHFSYRYVYYICECDCVFRFILWAIASQAIEECASQKLFIFTPNFFFHFFSPLQVLVFVLYIFIFLGYFGSWILGFYSPLIYVHQIDSEKLNFAKKNYIK